jgi:WhiB family redox-sensing transcriptional regulator
MLDPEFDDPASSRTPPLKRSATAAHGLSEWRDRGLCVGADPEVFFPPGGDPGTRARGLCAFCPVRDDCLRYATDADEFGIWGGLDQDERRELLAGTT